MSFSISQEWVVVLAYAILMGFGGWFGFKKSGSKPSLIAGVLSFAILVVAYFIGQMWIAVGVSALLSVAFFQRVSKTRKLMPSGMLLVLSAVVCIYLLYFLIFADKPS
tara:strand:- start:522 stop:845 length:324 start_codon:yes stop_codon:yes gene_type:complete